MDDKAWKKVNEKPKLKVRKIDQDLLNAAYFGILNDVNIYLLN